MDTRWIEEKLSFQYEYRKLPNEKSSHFRDLFYRNIPEFLIHHEFPCPLYTMCGTLICNDFDRIVVGDYGAFVEFSEPSEKELFITQPGQEYREKEPYRNNVKYLWLTVDDGCAIKIYKQLRGVTYADYKPGKYYVSVHDVLGEKVLF